MLQLVAVARLSAKTWPHCRTDKSALVPAASTWPLIPGWIHASSVGLQVFFCLTCAVRNGVIATDSATLTEV